MNTRIDGRTTDSSDFDLVVVARDLTRHQARTPWSAYYFYELKLTAVHIVAELAGRFRGHLTSGGGVAVCIPNLVGKREYSSGIRRY